jgi:hypothetical protein
LVQTYRRENGKYLKISLKKGIRLIGESTYRRVYTVLSCKRLEAYGLFCIMPTRPKHTDEQLMPYHNMPHLWGTHKNTVATVLPDITAETQHMPFITWLRLWTSSWCMMGRQFGSRIISRSSLMVKATWRGPLLPTRYTFFTRLLDRASSACWDMSVFWNIGKYSKYGQSADFSAIL